MEVLSAYIPMDRRRAIGRGDSIADRARGAALFADISGFTPLTEALSRGLGPRRGVEELTGHLNHVYDALINEVHRYRGSVIAFAGDAITCWFDGDNGTRATAAALGIQAAMSPFSQVLLPDGNMVALTVKAAVATGPARRFIVGDPEIQFIDVMAGQTLARMANGAHLAAKGEVVVDLDTATNLAQPIREVDWRESEDTPKRFAVVHQLSTPVDPQPWPGRMILEDTVVRPWLIQAVYDRVLAGQGEFLTELRPAVALFIKFDGIDYDADETAAQKLNGFVCWVQQVLARYEGFLIDVSIGDKGSYLYCAFGAPIAHENDAWRALTVALAIRTPPAELGFIKDIRIGISRGTMRTGAYGGSTRRTYGLLGDEVNLAARLMERAAAGQVLVSGRAQNGCDDAFTWQELPAIRVKGKTDLVELFVLLDARSPSALRLIEPTYALPMVGRTTELGVIRSKMDLALSGRGQILGITAEAGMGKSRLIAEVIKLANPPRFTGYGGQCQSYGTNTSYLVWWTIWRGLFHLDPVLPLEKQISVIEEKLKEINPILVPRLPLLGAVLNLPIPDNDVTRQFDAKLRKSSLDALLLDCLRHFAAATPTLLVLEDCHWIDPLSQDLLIVLSRAIVNLPVLLAAAYRPPDANRAQEPQFQPLPHFTEIRLADLTRDEAGHLITQKLAQLSGSDAAPPASLVERLLARSEGNPFYLEELLNYLQDQGIDPHDARAVERLELPTTLHSLILSRIDQLTENQRITLKVASVVGRLFQAATLWGIDAQLDEPKVKADLEALKKLDLTPLDKPEPELTYLFKHIVTQEVAYESLPYATRAKFHEAIGVYIEHCCGDSRGHQVDLLAFHFDRSKNEAKRREYLLKAGEAAQARYANSAAINYYERLLPLLPRNERIPTMLKLGRVLELVGQWNNADRLYREALALAQELEDRLAHAQCLTAVGELLSKRGAYTEAWNWLEQSRSLFHELGDEAGVAEALHFSGTVGAQQGDYDKACERYHESLAIRRKLNDKRHIASLLSNLGIISWYKGDFPVARSLYEESLEIRRELGDRWCIANSLNNLGLVLRDQGDAKVARTLLEESLAINRELGDRWSIANSLSSLGDVALSQRDYDAALAFLEESLEINQDLGDRRAIAFLFEFFAELAAAKNQPRRALRLAGVAASLRDAIGAPLSPAEQLRLTGALNSACAMLNETEKSALMTEGKRMVLEQAADYALKARAE
jgi:class 3 adenylate cyclase/tetratricopeptide (TPR) repeat protein